MRIYTRTGDDGTTGLLGGGRTAKTSPRMRAIGDVDELNAHLGLARASGRCPFDEELGRLQAWLFDLGAELAAPEGSKFSTQGIEPGHVDWIEAAIDGHMNVLPPLRAFILPGGTPLAATLHVARTVARRAERSVLELAEQEPVRPTATRFLNRISDYLFAAARTANALQGVPDVEWHRNED